MTNKSFPLISMLFLLVALYDGALGVIFLAAPSAVFTWGEVTPPNHFGYVQFPAALLIIFALMFVAVARDPAKHRDLMIYGILLKLSYCGLAFAYWFTSGIPSLWKPFAVIDLVSLGLFAWSFAAVSGRAEADSRSASATV
jgi:hypothetical protein